MELKGMNNRLGITSLVAISLAITTQCFGWGNSGHKAVVEVALELKPALRKQLSTILKDLPQSEQWKKLKESGLKKPNPYETEKSDPDGWVADLVNHPEKAGTFADWARDYKGYTGNKYDKIHFYNADFDDINSTRFVDTPNALTALGPFQSTVKAKKGGERAWALVWILHIVGDLHQPLHCTARAVPGTGKSDHGGNGVNYKSTSLHSYWDHLPDKAYKNGSYASTLVAGLNSMSPSARAKFQARTNNLQPSHWVKEGHDLIYGIGYPDDHKVTNYDAEAHKIANEQVLLAGARLVKVLEQSLASESRRPASPRPTSPRPLKKGAELLMAHR
jgi:hypothetical protein